MINIKLKIKSRHKQLLEYIKGSWFKLFLSMVCMVVVAATTSATAFIVKPVIDDIFISKNVFLLKLIPLIVIVLYFFRGLAMYGQEFLMQYVGESIIKKLRDALYEKITDLPLSFFHKERTGVLMSRITNDVTIIKSMVSQAVTGALRDCFTVIGLAGVIFYRDWKLAIMAFVVMPLAYFPVVELGRRVRRFSTSSQESMADMNAFLHETFAGNKIVKAFGMESYEKKSFSKKNHAVFRFEVKSLRAKALTSPVMEAFGGIGISLVLWYGGFAVIKGVQTPGDFLSFMTAVMLLYPPIKKLTKLNNVLQQGLAASDRVFDILETRSDILDPESPKEIKTGSHRISFENVSFSYDKSEVVLKNIDLDVKPGEVMALVGMSGGGKTSLVNLIPRFFDVTEGSVRIDGTDIRDIAVTDLRKQVAFVTQEPILFNDTIRKNIAYGKPEATDREIVEAAEAAYIYKFVKSLPKGFDTVIGELGSRLSGGEKQRMCIARALLKNAPILILDEATASLDTESERLVQKALENLMKGRTSFVIAHRLSTISYANRIVVLVGGQIVEEGKHEQLLEQKGEYYNLHQMQFADNNDAAADISLEATV
ncbi:MAG: lipid A export permease/ATP-binding protein MsbA [Desulfobacteraceae bacterium]|nr:lipid A export permease/ATP-binding protein MsbA [Desulfobacteraceae bacterium]MBC2755306.1 lipid A export permease/ATP-binding protein MsbA [Desulfobacteraceae bacterium]